MLKEEYRKLGPICFAEISVLMVFTLLILLWFTRDPGFVPGWATFLFNKDKEWVDITTALQRQSLPWESFGCLPRWHRAYDWQGIGRALLLCICCRHKCKLAACSPDGEKAENCKQVCCNWGFIVQWLACGILSPCTEFKSLLSCE